MLPKEHLTLHSKMSGCRCVITPSWLSGSLRSFLYISSVYSCHLFLIPSASVRPVSFLLYVPFFVRNVPLVPLFFWKGSLVFPILFFPLLVCIIHLRGLSCISLLFFATLHLVEYISPYLLCLLLILSSQLFVRPPQTDILLFCISFSWVWSWSLSPVQGNISCKDGLNKGQKWYGPHRSRRY